MHPWVLHTCHATTSCHLGVSRTVRLLRAFLLVDWRRCLPPLVDPPLPQMPGSQDFTPNDLLVYPAPVQQHPGHRQYRLRRPTAAHHERQPLLPHLRQPIYQPRRHVRHHGSAIHSRRHLGHLRRPVQYLLGVPCDAYLRQRPAVFLQALDRLCPPWRQQDQHQRMRPLNQPQRRAR